MASGNQANGGTSAPGKRGRDYRRLAMLSVTSLGVVYGDIGTSPLYAVRECFFGEYGIEASPANVLGVLSLITWSLIIVISIKYLVFVLRADNDSEGGILALMELVRRPARGLTRKFVLGIGIFGAALLYGDGMITPAISVLSAIEGLKVATPVFMPYVIPITIAVLAVLFFLQRLGTAGIGRLFGPIMMIWFTSLALSGAAAVARNPAVLRAVNPYYGWAFFLEHQLGGFQTLGIVFLVVTGGEALYADIGHFGKTPIRIGWYFFALPSLFLNYYGQGALILMRPGEIENPFYQLVPRLALYPMVALATCATVIASQAIISGIFSLTSQGFNLDYLPRIRIRHTSSEKRGQVYIPLVNWMLFVATVGLVLGFRHSGNLASAYGVAISITMLITSLLFWFAMQKIFRWPQWIAMLLTGGFLIMDIAFFTANAGKFSDGGWFPILIAGLGFLIMTTWRKGHSIEKSKSRNRILGVRQYLRNIGGGGKYRRVPGQAVYLTNNPSGTPHVMRRNIVHNRALHDKVVLYTASFVKAPHVRDEHHLKVKHLRSDITRIVAYYGFMENPDVPGDLQQANEKFDVGLRLGEVTYFLGGEIIMSEKKIGMSRWRSRLYTLMARSQKRATSRFKLPASQVFEIGTEVRV